MSRFIEIGDLLGRDCHYLNCDSVVALYPVQAYNEDPEFSVYMIRVDGGEFIHRRYSTHAEACQAAAELAERLEKCRS